MSAAPSLSAQIRSFRCQCLDPISSRSAFGLIKRPLFITGSITTPIGLLEKCPRHGQTIVRETFED